MRFKLPFTNRIFVVGFLDLDRVVIGLNSTSFCEESKQVLMLDYDKLTLEEVRQDIRRLQMKFGLPAFYVFRSSENKFHGYCMVCLGFNEAVMITFNSKSDKNHKECLLANKRSTLRITRKKGKDSKIGFVEKLIPNRLYHHTKFREFPEIPGAEGILKKVILTDDAKAAGISLSEFR